MHGRAYTRSGKCRKAYVSRGTECPGIKVKMHTRGPIINTWIYFSFCPWINSAINLTPQIQKKSYCPCVDVSMCEFWTIGYFLRSLCLARFFSFHFLLLSFVGGGGYTAIAVLLENCSWHLIAINHFKAIEKDYFLKCEGIEIVIVTS